MSVDTQTAPESVDTEKQDESTAPVLPTVPADDSDVRTHEQSKSRISDLLVIANTLPDQRDAMTDRALTLAVRFLTVSNPGDVIRERVLMHVKPADEETRRGHSQRFHYPKERSVLLTTIAESLAVAYELTARPYTYPANSKRNEYTVELFGAEHDVARVKMIRESLDTRLLAELDKLEFPHGVNSGQQTKQKRKYVADFTETLSTQLQKLVEQNESAASNASKRRTKSDARKQEWINTAS